MEDTINPRLLEAGADCSRVLVIDESIDCLSMADERLVRAIKEAGAKMVVSDPIQACLGADVYATDKRNQSGAEAVRKYCGRIRVCVSPYRSHK